MAAKLAHNFRVELSVLRNALLAISPALADTPWREGGWTRKQILGHLLDSAANNRQRFVRAATEGSLHRPKYAQDAWVACAWICRHAVGYPGALVAGGA
jgi:hypothetical protein